MAYNEELADRIDRVLARRKNIESKGMFGGIGWLLSRNMCVGVWKDSLVVRVGADGYEESLWEPFVSEFDITGRPMTGWILVSPEGITDDDQLREWIERAVRFVRTLPAKKS